MDASSGRRLRSLPGYEQFPIVMVTGQDDKQSATPLSTPASPTSDHPVDARECRRAAGTCSRCAPQMALRKAPPAGGHGRRGEREIREREKETLLRLARAGEFRDEETGYHLIRMARYSRMIANAIGLERDEAETIELAAPLHDLGKIGIPDGILLKPARLDAAEWETMQRHPSIGHEILKGSASKYVRMGALIALGHHERYDGKGYPSGLDGDHIPLCARIVAVADVYDALTSVRPYKKAWKADDALEYIRAQRGKHFDPRLADAFLGVSERVLEVQRDLQDPLAEAVAR